VLCLEPHPYVSLGAPYGAQADPFRLRSGVLASLLVAERQLAALRPGWRLLIFDAWRPLAVQRFMVQQAIGEQCRVQGVDPLEAFAGPGRDRGGGGPLLGAPQ
jgi:D-alanyl-D-alanine dipeptidase